MKSKRTLLAIIGIIITIILIQYLLVPKYEADSTKISYVELDKKHIECYENSLYFIFVNANIISDELNVQNVRCSQEDSYGQWEMNGTYFENNDHSKEPKPFYFHRISGGMAPSGADGYYEICLIINNQTVISKIETGRNSDYQSPARCLWQSKLP